VKPIGGYFELSLGNNKNNYHSGALALNTGRNCFEYIILAKNIKRIYIPKFTCKVILEPLLKHNISFEYYSINTSLEPIDLNPENDSYVLLTNYFGIKDKFVSQYAKRKNNLILDLSQSFYFKNYPPNVDAFYSARKFFGVSDGAYLYSNNRELRVEEVDISYQRITHLLKSFELGPESAYSLFKQNDTSLSYQPIKKMSLLTQRILDNIDIEKCLDQRIRNFCFLHDSLGKINNLKIELPLASPLTYPFLVEDATFIREKLIEQKIFVPTYWPELIGVEGKGTLEYLLAKNILHLPIDHRYSTDDMERIINVVKFHL